jgi:uridylate kinase
MLYLIYGTSAIKRQEAKLAILKKKSIKPEEVISRSGNEFSRAELEQVSGGTSLFGDRITFSLEFPSLDEKFYDELVAVMPELVASENIIFVMYVDFDQLGIVFIYFNVEFICLLFKDVAYTEVVKNPTVKIKTAKPVIVAGGWKPGCSTDKDAVLFAQNFKTREIYNLSNVEYIYTADPQVDPTAQKLEQVTWEELQKIVGTTWKPGLSAPFDPMATKLAKKLKLIVRFVKGSDLEAVKNVLNGKKWQGTSIE